MHCHQNNDPTLPMQMMVEIKHHSKIAPSAGFELIQEPNVWLRQGFLLNSEYLLQSSESQIHKAYQEFSTQKTLVVKLSITSWFFLQASRLMVQ